MLLAWLLYCTDVTMESRVRCVNTKQCTNLNASCRRVPCAQYGVHKQHMPLLDIFGKFFIDEFVVCLAFTAHRIPAKPIAMDWGDINQHSKNRIIHSSNQRQCTVQTCHCPCSSAQPVACREMKPKNLSMFREQVLCSYTVHGVLNSIGNQSSLVLEFCNIAAIKVSSCVW